MLLNANEAAKKYCFDIVALSKMTLEGPKRCSFLLLGFLLSNESTLLKLLIEKGYLAYFMRKTAPNNIVTDDNFFVSIDFCGTFFYLS